MSDESLKRAAVRRPVLKGKSPAQCFSIIGGICNAAAQSPEVQGSTVAAPALAQLKGALGKAEQTFAERLALAQALRTIISALRQDMGKLRGALGTFASAVDGVAQGDGVVIAKAGFATRDPRGASEALDRVPAVRCQPGKNPREAIVTWPAGPGATSYAIEVNYSSDPAAPPTALRSGTGRRRVIKATEPGGQFLVRVASLAADGTPSEWSDWALATAR